MDAERRDILADLDPADREAIVAACERRWVRRGDVLVTEGEIADTLFIVVSGRFAVRVAHRTDPLSEIGAGQPIGEIAYLTGGRRSATVQAIRDSIVLALERPAFDALALRRPHLWRALAQILANRLRQLVTATSAHLPPVGPRVLAVVPAGDAPLAAAFVARLERALARRYRTRRIDSGNVAGVLAVSGASDDLTEALNACEAEHDVLLLVADETLTTFSEKIIRHADVLLSVGPDGADPRLSPHEAFAEAYIAPHARRLVLLHDSRRQPRGTGRWLDGRRLAMHHHVCLADDADLERLIRFIEGRARGLVACGGGALCNAHVGVYEAFRAAGCSFDVMGGTSAGSAMTAAFALGWTPADIDDAVHEIFVTNAAMRRWSLPRYSLLDHTHFDRQLSRYYGGVDIEDMWLPFFAVSSDLTTGQIHRHMRGDVWRAIRASSSIPALLPPVYSDDGHMLVDGAILSNVPVTTMQDMKRGPNAVIAFNIAQAKTHAPVDYESLPSGVRLARDLVLPWRRRRMPAAPGVAEVLTKSLMITRESFQRHLGPTDVLLCPPLPPELGLLDWHRHTEVMRTACTWARPEIEALIAARHPLVADDLA